MKLTMNDMLGIPKQLICLLSRDQDSGMWLGHSLDFDIITSAPSEEEAWSALKQVVVAHVDSCAHDNFLEGLSRKANSAAWSAFIDVALTTGFRTDMIEFKRRPNNQTVWMKVVEVESLPSSVSVIPRTPPTTRSASCQ